MRANSDVPEQQSTKRAVTSFDKRILSGGMCSFANRMMVAARRNCQLLLGAHHESREWPVIHAART